MTSDLLHFACVNPVGLYTMKKNDQTVSFIDLYDAFPTTNHRYQPSVRIATMGASVFDTVLLHEQVVSDKHFSTRIENYQATVQMKSIVLLTVVCFSCS